MNRQNGYLMIMNCVWLQEWANSPPLKNETFDSCNPHTTWNCAGRIDCNYNEELFLAIAAIRNDTDIYQWFISPQGFFAFNDSHKDISKLPPLKWRKATVEELIEYFEED